MKTRIYFLDNLRTFLIFLVIVLHAGMTYERGFDTFWIVDDPAKLDSLAWVRTYIDLFVMFTMFFISGYFIPGSVKNKNGWEFMKSKFKRIFLPWIIAVFTLIPAYKIIFLYSRGLPQEEWFSYFHIFQRAGSDLTFFANNPSQNWLWFLPVLFVFQIAYLVLAKTNLFSVRISLKTSVAAIFVLGLIYSMVISELGLKGWHHSGFLEFQRERLPVYFMVFLLGSLCRKLNVFEKKSSGKVMFIVSILVLIPSLVTFKTFALNLFYNLIEPGRNHFIVSDFGDRTIKYVTALLSMLSFIYVLTYIFKNLFNKGSKFMDELNRNSYQVYIIHMIVIGVVALALLNVTMPVLVKYSLLIVAAFILSNALVSAYKRIFRNSLILKAAALIVFVAGMFSYIQRARPEAVPETQTEETTNIEAPAMGLQEAVLRNDVEVIKQHIAAGSNLNEKDPASGGNPLHTAATFGKTEIFKMLIEAGCDINYKNNDGSTPLHAAAFFGRTEIVKVLLDAGADKSIRNNAGSTALQSVLVPFEAVQGIYDYFGKAYEPLGLKLNYDSIMAARPVIAELLK